MGRSVSTPYNAMLVAYQTALDIEDPLDWDLHCDNLRHLAQRRWPSLKPRNGFLDREDRILLENEFAYFGVSEYCGLAAVWIAHKGDDQEPLAQGWATQIARTFQREFGELERLGTMSNGEAVFQRAA